MPTEGTAVSRTDDWIEIYEISAAYARAIDAPDLERLVALFTADGVWCRPEIGVHWEGTDSLRAGLKRQIATAQGGDAQLVHPSVHMITNPDITIEGDQARGEWYMLGMRLSGQLPDPISPTCGTYSMRYRRTEAGWRIERLELTVLWSGAVDRVAQARNRSEHHVT